MSIWFVGGVGCDACRCLGDAPCDPQGGELGGRERMRPGDGVAHHQQQPVGGGMQHETHLIGECRATTGAVGGKLALVFAGSAGKWAVRGIIATS
jgi:hypothetical protein